MLQTVLSFLSPKRIIYGLAAILIGFVVWKAVLFVDAKYEAEAEVERLERTVRDRDETILVMKQIEKQRSDAEEAADAARTALEFLQRSYNTIQNNISNTKDEDDGAIAPVLRNALRELDGLLTVDND